MRTYDRTLSLLRYGTVKDQYGDDVPGWTPLKENVPARRKITGGVERLASAELSATSSVTFFIPWSPDYADLDASDRVEFEGKPYNLTAVEEEGRHYEYRLVGTAENG